MPEDKGKIKILFLCTGNSCRSQMAEGWANALKSDVIDAYSAGICPVGVSSRAIEVMAESGVDISEHRSKHADEVMDIGFDFVITLCDNANQYCPIFPKQTRHIHKPFKDPTFTIGTEEKTMDEFRKTRDEIKAFIETLPETLRSEGG